MSHTLLKKTWTISCGAAGKKLLLVWLSDHAHEDGLSWPSVSTLCRQCDMSERTVQSHLAELEKDGLIRVERRGGRHLVNRYFVTINPANSAPFIEKPRENNGVIFAETPQISHETPQISHPNHKESKRESKGERNGAPKKFVSELNAQIKVATERIDRLKDTGDPTHHPEIQELCRKRKEWRQEMLNQ